MSTASTFLSQRARRLIDRSPLAPYILAHFEEDARAPYDAATRPDGYIGLCIAESCFMWSQMAKRLAGVSAPPARVLGYDAMIGALTFRERLAAFLGRVLFQRPARAEHLAVLAGAGAVLELLFNALGDPGDGVLVPTPSYAGFWSDLETRDALAIIPVATDSRDGFRLTPGHLDRALAEATRPVRALLFTTPDNPLGRVYTREETEAVVAWAERAGVHLVVDEVYGLSTFGATPFTSVAALRPSLGERIHVVWSFSKDFGAGGLRCGVLLSENEAVLRAVDALAYWAACSGDTQHRLGEIVTDQAWVDDYLATHRARLAEAYGRVTERLRALGIPYVPAEGGFFVVCDLRRFLPEPTAEGESRLWRWLLDDARLNVTPGAACRIPEPGFFRLCWSLVPLETTMVGIDRLAASLARAPWSPAARGH